MLEVRRISSHVRRPSASQTYVDCGMRWQSYWGSQASVPGSRLRRPKSMTDFCGRSGPA